MATQATRFTQKYVDSVSADGRQKTVWDSATEGLGLRVTPTGRRSFVFKYRLPEGKARSMTLGDARQMDLRAARGSAEDLARHVRDGLDPLANRQNADYFRKHKYVVVNGLVAPDVLNVVYPYAIMQRDEGGLRTGGDRQVPKTPSRYGDAMMETLLESLRPKIEAATGLALYPTYSYMRVYKTGDILKRHTDRPACEVSVTIPLGFEDGASWPIQADNGETTIAADLRPGDGMIYRGCDVPHWRDAYAGKQLAQVFLHYVDQNGPHADHRFDTRPSLGMRPSSKKKAQGQQADKVDGRQAGTANAPTVEVTAKAKAKAKLKKAPPAKNRNVAKALAQALDKARTPRSRKNVRSLVMFSGGLSSTALLAALLAETDQRLHVHHVEIRNKDGRHAAENRSVERIVPYLRRHYRDFDVSTSVSEFNLGLGGGTDLQLGLFVAGRVAKALKSSVEIVFTGHINPSFADLSEGAALFHSMFINSKFRPEWIWPLTHLKAKSAARRKDIWQFIPEELAKMTWSCRRPVNKGGVYVTCGKCRACKTETRLAKGSAG